MIKYKTITHVADRLADTVRTDRFEQSAAASKRSFDSDGQQRRDDETARNNSLI
jgi:hypothetical protein